LYQQFTVSWQKRFLFAAVIQSAGVRAQIRTGRGNAGIHVRSNALSPGDIFL
jgi:hypothetical protein